MNRRLLRVARAHCLETLDVFALDAAAGYHRHEGPPTFHVPRPAARRAATALLDLVLSAPKPAGPSRTLATH